MFITFIAFLLGWYIISIIGTYAYAVAKSYELSGIWSFEVVDGVVGVCRLPRWISVWTNLYSKKKVS